MKKLLVQKDVFSEDEYFAPLPIIQKYFDVALISDEAIMRNEIPKVDIFRGSLALAKKLGRKYEYANALSFMPRFRDKLVCPDVVFTDLEDIKSKLQEDDPRFVRPVSGFKEFSGNVFTKESFESEYNFAVKNKNLDKGLICAVADPVKIGREWRAIFIDNKFVSGSQYMENGELNIIQEIPENVVEFAKKIAGDDYFLNTFEFVIDIAEIPDRLALIEVNAFETASFYGADLDLIYKTWSEV